MNKNESKLDMTTYINEIQIIKGMTINTGNFENIRIEMGLKITIPDKVEKQIVYDFAINEIDSQLKLQKEKILASLPTSNTNKKENRPIAKPINNKIVPTPAQLDVISKLRIKKNIIDKESPKTYEEAAEEIKELQK